MAKTKYVVCPDVSSYQRALDSRYTRDVLIFRVTFGAHYLDPLFLANASAAATLYAQGKIAGVVLYHGYTKDPVKDQFAATWNAIGPKVPAWLIGVMLDAETWRGASYALAGNHSKQLNQLYGLHAHKMGSWSSVLGYGNQNDLRELWPSRDKRCHVVVASYGSRLVVADVPGAIGQQYTDGQTRWPRPKIDGKTLPLATEPFGACDHNVFPGFADGKALRAFLRPVKPVAKPPVAKPPVPPVKPPVVKPPYDPAVGDALVSKNGRHALILHDDGVLESRVDHKHYAFVQQSG